MTVGKCLYSARRNGSQFSINFRTGASLDAASFRSPIHEVLHLMAIFPKDFQELRGTEIFCFLAQKRFQPPVQIRAIPRMHPVTACHNPVVRQKIPHF